MPDQLDTVRAHARFSRADPAHCGTLPLTLCVEDPDTLAELQQYGEGEERERFALAALRIGVLALRQARGQIDGAQIRHESERLLHALNDSGRLYLTQTRVCGRYVIRFAIGQRTTTREHVQRAWHAIQETARSLACDGNGRSGARR